ncbi:unnamed protein product, partial [Iphiclides podalirius]
MRFVGEFCGVENADRVLDAVVFEFDTVARGERTDTLSGRQAASHWHWLCGTIVSGSHRVRNPPLREERACAASKRPRGEGP